MPSHFLEERVYPGTHAENLVLLQLRSASAPLPTQDSCIPPAVSPKLVPGIMKIRTKLFFILIMTKPPYWHYTFLTKFHDVVLLTQLYR